MDIKKTREQIIKFRFIDAKKTYSLCLKLLEYVKSNSDSYSEVFAYTYLGDYYISQNMINEAFINLTKAKSIAEEYDECHQMLATIYSFIGIAYELDGEEQNAIQNYLEGMSKAKENNEKYLQSINLNNLAVIFYKHCHWDKALEYFLKAYDLQKDLTYFPSRSRLLCNIGDLFLQINDKDKALYYYNKSESNEENDDLKYFYHCRNQCCYLAAKHNREQTIYWAKKILDNQEAINNRNDFNVFDNYHMLCMSMFKIDEQEFCFQFIELMEGICQGNTNQLQVLEKEKLRYVLMFGSEEDYSKAYQRYYRKTQEFKNKSNQDIVKSMKDKIYLNEVIIEKENLEVQQKTLEKEVNFDEITGIYSKKYLDLCIQKYTQESRKNIAVIMLDVDYFKEYNDAYGHGEGDNVLKIVADCLLSQGQIGIKCFRFGGDEFTCFCEDMSIEEVDAYIKKIRKELHRHNIKHDFSPCADRVTLSIGYVYGETGRITIFDLLEIADEALYESKVSGRNMYRKKKV